MKIELGEHFSYKKLLQFTFPSMMMLVFTSIYGVVDGYFVSNHAGKTPYAALNLIWPLVQVFIALGFMMGSGGAAIVGKTLGEGKDQKAKEYFSLTVMFTIILGIISTIIGFAVTPSVAVVFKAEEGLMMESCITYGRINFIGITFAMLQMYFQELLITAERPDLGFRTTVFAGVTNMVLDWLLVGVLDGGIAAAAWATVASEAVGAVMPMVYFARENGSKLRLCHAPFVGPVIIKSITNGSSEFIGNISASIVSMLYNWQLLRFAGEDGVAAYGSIMYISFIFCAIFFGFNIGTAPVISFHYGAGNRDELKSLFRKCTVIVASMGLLMTLLSMLLAEWFTELFVGYDRALTEMTLHGMYIFNIVFLMMGFNVFASSMFTALNNGLVSAVLSFCRIFVIASACIVIMPEIWGMEGIWWSVPVSEVLALSVTVCFELANRKKYGYM